MVDGIWYMVYGIWYMVYGIWYGMVWQAPPYAAPPQDVKGGRPVAAAASR